MKFINHRSLILAIITIFYSLTNADARGIDEIKRSGKLYAAFTESSLGGVNHKLAIEFAKFLNVELVIVNTVWEDNFSKDGEIPGDYQTNPSLSYTPDALKKADFICGTIYILEWRKKFFNYAGILDLSDLLIIPKKNKILKSYKDLKGLKIAFLENSSYETHMLEINNRIEGGIQFIRTSSEEESVRLIKQGKADGFITTSYNGLEIVKQSDELKIAFPIAPMKKIGWAVAKGNISLENEINNFFETIKGNGRLSQIFLSHYGIDYNTYYEILNSYNQSSNDNVNQRDLEEIIESGKLVIALREKAMVYNKDQKQFNHYMAEEFAKWLGVKLEIKITPYFSKYFENSNGEILKDSTYTPEWFNYVDLACEVMVPLKWRRKQVDIIPFIPYAQVVIGRKNAKISSLNDLKKYKGVIAKGSAQEDILIKNNVSNYKYAKGIDFISEINKGRADYTIGSDIVYDVGKSELLEVKFVIGQVKKDGWAIKRNHPKLRRKIIEFIEYAKKEGIIDKYFKIQTGMSLKSTENYLTVLQETYQPGVFPFVFYGTKEGLPQENILSIFQDKDNYMWFGSHAGAIKYNGREMHVYNKENGFSGNSVFDIAQDKQGRMFFATLEGISILENGKLRSIFPNYSFRKIFIDNDDNKWFLSDNGITMYTKNNKQVLLSEQNLNLPLYVSSVAKDKKGDIYIASKKGLYLLSNNSDVKQLSNKESYTVFVDSENQLWLSTIDGVHLIELDKYKYKGIGKNINHKLNLPENTIIKDIKQTKDGTLWFVSDSKIFQLVTLQQKPIVYDEEIGLMKQRIMSFFEDRESNLWVGYSGGIQKLTNKSLRLLHPKLLDNYVNSIVEDKTGAIWFSTGYNVFISDQTLINFTKSFSDSNRSYTVTKLSNGNILIASNVGLYQVDVRARKVIATKKFEQPLQYIERVFVSSKNEIFVLTGVNGIIYYIKTFNSKSQVLSNLSTSLVYQLVEVDDMIIGGNNTGLVYFDGKDFEKLVDIGKIVWSLCPDGDRVWVGTEKGIGYLYEDEFHKLDVELPGQSVTAITKDVGSEYLWIGTNKGFAHYNKISNKVELSIDSKDGLQGNEISVNGLSVDNKGLLWITGYHGLATFDIKKNKPVKYTPEGKIEKIWLNGQEVSIDRLSEPLKYYENNITFELTGLSFKDEQSIEYDFFMKGLENDYSASSGKNFKAQYTNLPPGKYQFNYRTKGNDGIWSYYKQIKFEIKNPIYFKWWFILLILIILLALIYGAVMWRSAALKRKNAELERIVKERTSEISHKNEELQQRQEEIMAQRDEIERQRDKAEEQRDEISIQKKEITDSIMYASRIQRAILPPAEFISESFPEHFILFRPRDIVSGDYYWMYKKEDVAILVAADCTGHGVPGAFMSMLGSAFLNEIVTKQEKIPDANEILNKLRNNVIESLHQTGAENETKDGMDIALVIIDFSKNKLTYAGAFNSLYLVHDSELIEYKADRMPIGVSFNQNKSFKKHEIDIQKGDSIYIFSDGFIDQFGGERGKKFKSSNFRNLLLENHKKDMEQQKEILSATLDKWRGKIEQIDDVLVMGVRIP